MKNYTVRTGCEIAGRWRDAGEPIQLSADQARELAPPFGDVVSEVKEKGKEDAKLNRRQRRNRRTPD
ncbi:hypothetical protein CFBP5507_26165 (plasmid) [Agrobacterium salinitolerans]|uniref:Uncharacterized protein n=1 Tax=Agrobacterium salinitolerans TaxID=1183413 RepID=A0A4Z1R8D7_9HYPH|nr:hypothetical protein [Agrobacterium salinitolerans]UYZ11197.1 hypothetical protein CFBP5507_26165 [Agrobacterium salinitolerans]